MQYTFEKPLISGKFIKRYKRFFVDAEIGNGEVVTAHCANTGSMMGLLDEGNEVWLTPVDDPKRKLKYSLEMINVGPSLVGVNTSLPNKLVASALEGKHISGLADFDTLHREVKYGTNSRIDVLLEKGEKKTYIEVKNTTLRQGDAAAFPDAVTTRGAKHLDELENEVKNGNRAVMFYLVQRQDCQYFSPAGDIDPVYTEKLRKVAQTGVEIVCYACDMSPKGIKLSKPLEIIL